MKKIISPLIIALAIIISVFAINSDDFDLIKNLEIYQNVLKKLRTDYVDEVDINKLVTTSIKSMLKTLDPYTVYYPENEIEDARLFYEASYTGVGIIVSKVKDRIFINEVLEGSPADKSGIKPGYELLEVNGKSLKGLSMQQIHMLITGEPGTFVKMKLLIPGTEVLKEVDVERKNIKLKAVSYYGKTNDNIGYIKLEQFTNSAYSEFKEAFLDLKKQKIKGLIIDLRDNPGGLLNEAVDILSIFLPKGTMVVSTKGKNPENNMNFKTTIKPIDTKIPIVVLVNQRSASASEIVAGTLQDLDRAVIMGEQTFGKGLVQRTAKTGYNTMIKLTISKYYIPSGRCIQAYDYKKHKSTKNVADSLLKKFYTKNGRVVFEGKGITPDIELNSIEKSAFVDSLAKNKIFIRFAAYYNHIKQQNYAPTEINFNDWEIFNEFLEKTYTYRPQAYVYLDKIEKENIEELSGNTLKQIQLAKNEIKKDLSITKLVETNKTQIGFLLNQKIITYNYYRKGLAQFISSHDNQVQEASKILSSIEKYQEILK